MYMARNMVIPPALWLPGVSASFAREAFFILPLLYSGICFVANRAGRDWRSAFLASPACGLGFGSGFGHQGKRLGQVKVLHAVGGLELIGQ